MKTKSIYILKIGLRLKFIRLYFDEILHTFTNPWVLDYMSFFRERKKLNPGSQFIEKWCCRFVFKTEGGKTGETKISLSSGKTKQDQLIHRSR